MNSFNNTIISRGKNDHDDNVVINNKNDDNRKTISDFLNNHNHVSQEA